jgi:aspartate aminotransferase-like enzyme
MREPSADRPLLLIPGPTEVAPEVAQAALRPMVGHRGPEIRDLLDRVLPRVARVIGTSSSVYPLGCSATGAMEAAVRNAAPGPFLHLVCGAFSERWAEIRRRCGLDGDVLEVDWGEAIDADRVGEALDRRRYGAVTLVHNETSTGVMNPIAEIAAVVRRHPDTLLLVDTVSSMAAVELRLDAWGVDVCFAGTQKAWALPPGLTLCAVSERARRRSERALQRGYYFDWTVHEASLRKGQTPTTPPISLLQQLDVALDRLDAEGLAARYARHRAMQQRVIAWAGDRFVPFATEGFRSMSLTALHAGPLDLTTLLQRVRARGTLIGNGYGKTKGKVFRIGHMGEWTLPALEAVLAVVDEELESLGSGPAARWDAEGDGR